MVGCSQWFHLEINIEGSLLGAFWGQSSKKCAHTSQKFVPTSKNFGCVRKVCFCRRHTSGCRLLRNLSQLLRTLSQLLRTLSKVLRSSGQLLRTLGQTSKKFALTSKNLVSEVCPAPTVQQLLKSGCSFDALGPAVAHAVQICTWGVNVLKIANLRRFLPGMLQHCVYLVCMCVDVYIYIYIYIY